MMRPTIRGRNIMITGGAGFIGSHLADRLLDEGAACVVAMDNMFLGHESNLAQAVSRGAILYKDDAAFPESVEYILQKHDIDIVFNLATKALNYSFINPKEAFSTNVTVMGNLLELQRKGRFQTLCHFSSSEVYGTALYEPMDEKHPYNPTTTYAGGKAAADVMLKTYVSMFDLDAFIVRPFNNYGPRQNWEGPLAGIIPATAARILQGGQPELHGAGTQCRDFIYVKDTVDVAVKLFDVMERGDEVNVSACHMCSMQTLMNRICAIMGYRGEIVHKPRRGADVECHNATNEKLKKLITFCPTDFTEGLTQTLCWYKENLS